MEQKLLSEYRGKSIDDMTRDELVLAVNELAISNKSLTRENRLAEAAARDMMNAATSIRFKEARGAVIMVFVGLVSLFLSVSLSAQDYTPTCDEIIYHKGYRLAYDEVCEQPKWVYHMVTKIDLEKPKFDRKNDFRVDTMISTGSADAMDYKGSGYDRGHLAPAGDFAHDKELLSESFYYSNMSPQAPSFNRGVWRKIENSVREMAAINDTVYVVTGAILHNDLPRIGENKVCVPQWYFKVVYSKKGVLCYLIKNEGSKSDVTEFIVPIDRVIALTGINLKLK